MTANAIEYLVQMMDELAANHRRLLAILDSNFGDGQEWFSTEEFAARVNRKPWTVRSWLRDGRLIGRKRPVGRGKEFEWEVPASELERFRNHGLLPVVKQRNK